MTLAPPPPRTNEVSEATANVMKEHKVSVVAIEIEVLIPRMLDYFIESTSCDVKYQMMLSRICARL